MAVRLELFKDILRHRFRHKTLTIDRTYGFKLESTVTKARLEPSALSSGEQNEVVMLYEMLFRVPENSLILIDEPEISLHIAWQEQFLSDLERIIALSPFDALVATHSPQIVSDRWSLTVELRGVEDDN